MLYMKKNCDCPPDGPTILPWMFTFGPLQCYKCGELWTGVNLSPAEVAELKLKRAEEVGREDGE